jgi:hypothetical protein
MIVAFFGSYAENPGRQVPQYLRKLFAPHSSDQIVGDDICSYPEDRGSMFLRNISAFLTDYIS